MENKYIFPIFEDDDRELAIEYLYEKMKNQFSIDNMYKSDDGHSSDDSDINNGIARNFILTIISDMYGVNIHRVANAYKVQEQYLSLFKESILNYLNHRGINSYITEMEPGPCIKRYIPYKVLYKDSTPLTRWNPDIDWYNIHLIGEGLNLPDSILTDKFKDYNIMNPFNDLIYSYLFIESKDLNHDFKKYIYQYNLVLEEIVDRGIYVKLLPSLDFNRLETFMRLIHTYL